MSSTRTDLTKFAWLSIAAALVTIALKTGAWLITGSVGLASDAAESVVKLFDGKIVYINVMKNMSVDCDCCAVAEDPCMKDIGILASLDPIAIDQACLDLVYASDDPGRDHLVERIESLNGVHTVEAAAELGFGSREYELIEL